MRNFTYLADGQGNIRGVVDRLTGNAEFQTFDAFGNIHGSTPFAFAKFRIENPNASPPVGDFDERNLCETEEAPNEIERMAGGMYQWRGSEGSITDRASQDMCVPDGGGWEHEYAADTRPSTGLIYMRARYYDPAVGRFTQADPMPYGLEMMWGQNNRWTYCANDPVNASDPNGQFSVLLGIAVGFALGMILGALAAHFGFKLGLDKLLIALGALFTTQFECSHEALKQITDPSLVAILRGMITLLGADLMLMIATPGAGFGIALGGVMLASVALGFVVGNMLYEQFD